MKKTPLHQWHVDNGANMAEFGSYSMPLWYPQGAKKEHINVIENAGLFDTSHMAVVLVKGVGARQLLQKTFSKDLEKCIGLKKTLLVDGRCIYGLFLKENGHVIDDAIVYQVVHDLYMIVINAGMGGEIASHLAAFAGGDVETVDLTDKVGKIDIQGPASAKILSKLLQDPQATFTSLPYFSFQGWFEQSGDLPSVLLKDGTPVLLSRTGYTGEFGFELFLPPDRLEKVWTDLLQAGESKNVMTCGLAARDSLRAGAVLPLSHQDVGDWPFAANPWGFALALETDSTFSKSFFGSEALSKLEGAHFTLPFAGYDPRKIPLGNNASVFDAEGTRIGEILTCATDMAIGRVGDNIVSIATKESDGRPEGFKPRGLCCGFVKVGKKFDYGDKIFLSDGKRKIEVEIRRDIRPDRTARCSLQEML